MLTAHQKIGLRRVFPDLIELVERGRHQDIVDVCLSNNYVVLICFSSGAPGAVARGVRYTEDGTVETHPVADEVLDQMARILDVPMATINTSHKCPPPSDASGPDIQE
jgi:hypothetical protein